MKKEYLHEKMVKENSNNEYMMEFEEVDRDSEEVPIMLKNSRLVSAFEGITSTYALPKYNEVDPTPLYAPIYAFFFGMMSADLWIVVCICGSCCAFVNHVVHL